MTNFRYRKPHRIRRKRSPLRSRFFWITLLIIIFLGIAFYFAIFSKVFQIKEIIITGNKKIQAQDLENLIREKINQRLLFFSTKSIFLINSEKIVNSILEKFPQAEETALKRKLPATLIFEIQERTPVAIWCQARLSFPSENFGGQGEKCFFVDKFGIIFETGPENYDLVIKFQDETKDGYLGEQIVKEEQIRSILEIQERLKTNLKIITKEFIIQNANRINVKTIEGWEIYFDLREDIDWQLTKLRLVLEKEIPAEKREKLEYIDLRFGNFAPYKYRTPPTTEESP